MYRDNASKAEDNKSSAFTLLFVGGAGIIFIILCIIGVIDLNLHEVAKYMAYGLLGGMFVLFFVMGIVSLRSFKDFSAKAVKEDTLTEEISNWCKASLSASQIDSLMSQMNKNDAENTEEPIEPESDEELYFKRTEIMKKLISEKFMNLDEAYLDHFIDKMYSDIFSE